MRRTSQSAPKGCTLQPRPCHGNTWAVDVTLIRESSYDCHCHIPARCMSARPSRPTAMYRKTRPQSQLVFGFLPRCSTATFQDRSDLLCCRPFPPPLFSPQASRRTHWGIADPRRATNPHRLQLPTIRATDIMKRVSVETQSPCERPGGGVRRNETRSSTSAPADRSTVSPRAYRRAATDPGEDSPNE